MQNINYKELVKTDAYKSFMRDYSEYMSRRKVFEGHKKELINKRVRLFHLINADAYKKGISFIQLFAELEEKRTSGLYPENVPSFYNRHYFNKISSPHSFYTSKRKSRRRAKINRDAQRRYNKKRWSAKKKRKAKERRIRLRELGL